MGPFTTMTISKILVKTKESNYPILIGNNALNLLKKQIGQICPKTKKVAVMSIMTPTISDLVALAPTNPMIISIEEIGAARTS